MSTLRNSPPPKRSLLLLCRRQGPGIALFDALKAQLGDDVPIMAEDLGVITKDVVALR